ncbi:hypothetical protein ACNKXS_03655, partial [Christiangramia marina]|uniref:hypothetical protein n=1 Tax=Christiangramia marina TaxID=409436 RepID=UPI003AA7B6A8
NSKFTNSSFSGFSNSCSLNSEYIRCQFKDYHSKNIFLFNYFDNCTLDSNNEYIYCIDNNYSGSQFYQCSFQFSKIEKCKFDICEFSQVIFKKHMAFCSFIGVGTFEQKFELDNQDFILEKIDKPSILDGIETSSIHFSLSKTGTFGYKQAKEIAVLFNSKKSGKNDMPGITNLNILSGQKLYE